MTDEEFLKLARECGVETNEQWGMVIATPDEFLTLCREIERRTRFFAQLRRLAASM